MPFTTRTSLRVIGNSLVSCARQSTPARPQREIKVPIDADDIPFFRKPKEATAGAGFGDGQGFGPKYKEGAAQEDILDVPTFLRKQFD